MTVFLPAGLVMVSKAQTSIERLLEGDAHRQSAVTAGTSVPTNRTMQASQAKRRFLAVNSKQRLSLYVLNEDGSIRSKPVDILDLTLSQDSALGDFYQGSQLVVHPRLNVIYECSLDAAMRTLKVDTLSINEDGKLSRAGGPIALTLDDTIFRGSGFGVTVALDPSGNYLYLTQGSRGAATGQRPQIPFYRLKPQGELENKPLLAKLPLPPNEFFSVCLEPGPEGSNDVYGFVAPCASGSSGSTAYHFEAQKDGDLKSFSQIQLSDSGVFRSQSSRGFLRNSTWGIWEGIHLDDGGNLLNTYTWPRPQSGASLYELTPGQALGISHSKDASEARVFDLDSLSDRPTASEVSITLPRLYYEPGKVLTDAQTQQVLFFDENEHGLEVTRIGLQSGNLRAWKPQLLDDCGSMTSNTSKVQILSVY